MLVVPNAINSEAMSVENATSVLLDLPGFRVVEVRRVENETARKERRLAERDVTSTEAVRLGDGRPGADDVQT